MPFFSSARFLGFLALTTERERPALGLGDRAAAAAGALTRRRASAIMVDRVCVGQVSS